MSNDYTDQHSMPPWMEEDKSFTYSIKWGESISEKTCQALRDLGWVDPNEMQDKNQELETARATMLVNFGPGGKTIHNLVQKDDTLNVMITKVFIYYEEHYAKDGRW